MQLSTIYQVFATLETIIFWTESLFYCYLKENHPIIVVVVVFFHKWLIFFWSRMSLVRKVLKFRSVQEVYTTSQNTANPTLYTFSQPPHPHPHHLWNFLRMLTQHLYKLHQAEIWFKIIWFHTMESFFLPLL